MPSSVRPLGLRKFVILVGKLLHYYTDRWARFQTYPELWILPALTLIFWPLRDRLTALSSLLTAVLTLAIFLLPGVALVCLVGDDGNWWERLALAFVASLAIPGLAAQVVMLLHTSLVVYVWAFLVLTIVLLMAAAVRCWVAPDVQGPRETTDRLSPWLLATLLAVVIGLVYFSFNSPTDGDQWNIAAWIQNILYDPHIMVEEPLYGVGFPVSPRYLFSTWLVHQGLMSFLGGLDPVEQFQALRVPLMLLSLGAIFRLACTLSARRDAAALMCAAWGLYLMLWNKGTVAGYELIVRPDLDKSIAAFTLLPTGLSMVLSIFNRRLKRDWIWLVICTIAAPLTHPLAIGLMGLSLAGFGLLELVTQYNRQTFFRLVGVATILSLGAILSVISAIQMNDAEAISTSLTDLTDPGLPKRLNWALSLERIWILESGDYILHPRLILQTLHIPAFLGLPLLVWRLRGCRSSRLLFGMLVLIPGLLVFPLTAGLLGRVVTPWLLFRLHWPISLAAAMTLGWGAWGLLQKVLSSRWRTGLGVTGLLIVFGIALPHLEASLQWLIQRKIDPVASFCTYAEPILRPIKDLTPRSTMVLAEQDINLCLASYAPYANILEFRTTNVVRYYPLEQRDEGWQRVFDSYYFSGAEFVDDRLMEILDRYDTQYLIVRLNSPLEPQLRHLPELFYPVTTGFHRRIYAVVRPRPNSPLVVANSALLDQRWSEAIEAYQKLLLSDDANTRYLAAIGLGRAYLQTGRLDDAIAAWEKAAQTIAEGQVYALLGDAYALKGDLNSALHSYRQAVALQPDNDVFLGRLGYVYGHLGQLDQALSAFKAASAQNAKPGTIRYYQQLGQYLAQINAYDLAIQAYQKALSILDDSSLYWLIGQAYQKQRRWKEAEAAYRKVLALDRWDPSGHLGLGSLYQDQGQFERAMAEYREALRLHAMAPMAYASLGELWYSQYGSQTAISNLTRLVGYRLGIGDAVSELAALEAKAGRIDQALANDQRALDWHRIVPGYWQALADHQLAAGLWDEANMTLRQVLDLGQQEAAAAYAALAGLFRQQGRNGEALGHYWEAIRADPNNSSLRLGLGSLFEQLGQIDQALAQYQTALRLDPMDSSTLVALGAYYERQGRRDQAMNLYERALQLGGGYDAHQALGDAYLTIGEVNQAIEHYHRAIQLSPGKGQSRVSLGAVYWQMGRKEEALDQYRQSIQFDPGFAPAYSALGASYTALGRWDEAEAIYQQAIAALPAQDFGYYQLGQLYEQIGQPELAELTYWKAITKLPTPQVALSQLGLSRYLRRKGEWQAAEEALLAAIAAQPTMADGYIQLASQHSSHGRWSEAEGALQMGLLINPGSPELLDNLGDLYVRLGQIQKALETYQQALIINPSFLPASHSLATLYQGLGQLDEAKAWLDQARKIRPGDTTLLDSFANLYLAKGQLEEALTVALKRADLAPGEAQSWMMLGDVYTALGHSEMALDAYQHATQIEPGNSSAWLSLGSALARGGWINEATSAYQRAAQLDYNNPSPHISLGELYKQQGVWEKAIQEYEFAIQADASQGEGWMALGQLYQSLGRLDEAEQAYRRALAIVPAEAMSYSRLAELYMLQGKFDEALKQFQRATEVAPGSCVAFDALGDFQASRGHWLEALAAYQRALALCGCQESVHISLGNLYIARAKPEEAIAEYKQAIAANPGDAWGYIVLADTYINQARCDEAMATYEQASAIVPASDLLYTAMSRGLISQGKLREGLAAAQKAVGLRPSNAFNFITLGQAYQVLGEFNEAESSYQRAAEVDRSLPDPYLSLGNLYTYLARFGEGQAAYEQAIDVAPTDPRGYSSLAAYLQSRGQTQEAITLYEQGAAADKSQIGALLSLGELCQSLGRLDEAEQAYRRALAIAPAEATPYSDPAQFRAAVEAAPASGQAHVALGDWHRMQADWEGAEAYWKAIEVAPADPSGYIGLGELYKAQGRWEEALAQFQAAVEAAPASGHLPGRCLSAPGRSAIRPGRI